MSSPNESKAKKERKEDHSEKANLAKLSPEELMELHLAAKERAETAEERAELAEERAEKETKRAEMEREEKLAAQEQAKVEKALREGTFFATFDEVWEPDAVRFSNADYRAMIRDKDYARHSTIDDSKWKTCFLQTWENAGHTSLVAADATSKSTMNSDVKNSMWPVGVLQLSENDGAADNGSPTSNKSEPAAKAARSTDVAHLVPASPTNASLYHHVAIWFFGIQRDDTPSFVQKLIHGSSKPNPTPGSAEPLQRSTSPRSVRRSTLAQRSQRSTSAERPKQSGSGRRVNLTGLKHMPCNMIRLSGQARYFDTKPCLIIVPILSLQEAKTWQGHGYSALFMISRGSKEKGKAEGLDEVAAAVNMLKFGATANQSDIDMARDLLAATLKGLAFALFQKSAEHMPWVEDLSDDSKKVLNDLQANATVVSGEESILVPKDRLGYTKLVRKITFAPVFGTQGNDHGHPAPDPLLLAVKAGVNWSAFHKQQLLPAGEDDDESDFDLSEQSIAAMEEYLAMREYYQRVSRHGEIMNMDIRIPQG